MNDPTTATAVGSQGFAQLPLSEAMQANLQTLGYLAMTPIQAAALPLAGLTAWQGLFEHGALKAGQRVLNAAYADTLRSIVREGPATLYGGALGYVDLRGNLDFCITIRTLQLRDGRATLQ